VARVPELLANAARERPDATAFRSLPEGGSARPERWSWGAWATASRRVAAALVDDGLEPGGTVAIFAGNRPVWPVADLGTMEAGLKTVGLYPSSSSAQIAGILRDSGAAVAVVDTPQRLARVREVRDRAPELRTVVCVDACPEGVTGWNDWLEAGEMAAGREAVRKELIRRRERTTPDDVAALIYTSGSTGEPKGAQISHRYLLTSAASIRQTLDLSSDDTTLSFLPFCHAAERVFGLYTRLLCRMEAGLVEDPRRVWDAARAYHPTLFGGLPRFWEKVHEGIEAGGDVTDFLGDRLRLATSGGATLPETVSEELAREDVTVLGAYGLTEHLCVAFNRPDRHDLATSGPPMPGTELRLAEDDEILVRRSALTFSGYLGRPEATREAFTADGRWLRTGDLGELTPEGFLKVVGRKKELLALSTGKMVAPLPLERALEAHPWVSDAIVFGEGRKFVSALVVPRREAVEAEARRREMPGSYAELLEHPVLRAKLRAAVEEVNRAVSRTESIRRFLVRGEPLSRERGELTPTGKVRRFRVEERISERLDALYEGRAGTEAAPDPGPDRPEQAGEGNA
jgi:long-chain acyl-CoA synthetase